MSPPPIGFVESFLEGLKRGGAPRGKNSTHFLRRSKVMVSQPRRLLSLSLLYQKFNLKCIFFFWSPVLERIPSPFFVGLILFACTCQYFFFQKKKSFLLVSLPTCCFTVAIRFGNLSEVGRGWLIYLFPPTSFSFLNALFIWSNTSKVTVVKTRHPQPSW